MKDRDLCQLGAEVKGSKEFIFTHSAAVSDTRNTMIAAALLTLGVKLSEKSGLNLLKGDGIPVGGAITWQFEEQSEDGKVKTADVISKWENRKWLTAEGNEDPLAFIACAFHNYKRLIDHIKQEVPIGVVRNGKKFALIRTDAPDAFVGFIEKALWR